jgi:hypothetical protein
LITREDFINLAVVEASHPAKVISDYVRKLENLRKVDASGGTKENQETQSMMTAHYHYH